MSAIGTGVALIYLLSAVLFIVGLKQMARVRSAKRGNLLAAFAMLLAVVGTLLEMGWVDYRWIVAGLAVGGVVGAVLAIKVPMTSMPEMVALLNGCGGAASALVSVAFVYTWVIEPMEMGTIAELLGGAQSLTIFLSVLVGAFTFSGSLVAYGKLSGKLRGTPILLPGRHVVHVALLLVALLGGLALGWIGGEPAEIRALIWGLFALSLILGVLLVLPIGGADMPVVVSLLNSYSGVAAAMTGFVVESYLLIISGAMVGAAGLILTRIMCKAMNRSLGNVIVGGFGGEESGGAGGEYVGVRSSGAEEAAMVLESARSVVVVPGYGLAVAQAQHAVRELGEMLERRGAKVTYAIHPVAGRMPGHMNVLLAEADVPYEKLWEMERINPEFRDTDVVLVLGANDVVNPAALTQQGSPIYGMPILEVHNARSVFVVKRSLGAGYAGIKNELFEHPNTMMLFGDAKQVLQDLTNELKQL